MANSGTLAITLSSQASSQFSGVTCKKMVNRGKKVKCVAIYNSNENIPV
jgi:hypothetical protein